MSLGIQESDLLLREDYSALKLSVRDLHTCAHRFMRTDSVISDRWYIGAYTRCTLIPCKYRAAICSATVRVCVCVCVLNEIRLCPIHQGKSSFSASLLLHVGSWLSRPKPHVIYPATSPTNYSLHTAAENQRPHTFLTHTHTHTSRVSESEGGTTEKENTQDVQISNNTYESDCIHLWHLISDTSCAHFLPICMTRPKTEELSTVLQFQRRCLNWYWHSLMPVLAPSPMYCMWSW